MWGDTVFKNQYFSVLLVGLKLQTERGAPVLYFVCAPRHHGDAISISISLLLCVCLSRFLSSILCMLRPLRSLSVSHQSAVTSDPVRPNLPTHHLTQSPACTAALAPYNYDIKLPVVWSSAWFITVRLSNRHQKIIVRWIRDENNCCCLRADAYKEMFFIANLFFFFFWFASVLQLSTHLLYVV